MLILNLTSIGFGLINGHGSEVFEIALVSDQHHDDVLVCMISQLSQPPFNIFIGEVLSHVIHQQGPKCSSIVSVLNMLSLIMNDTT